MDGIFAVQAVMSLVDNITGPLKAVRGQMRATESGAGRLAGKMALLSKKMLPVALVAGIIAGGLGFAALATAETQRALGELASVGVKDMAAMETAGASFSDQWAGTTKAQFISAAYDIKSGISSLSDTGVAEFTRLAALTGKATKSTTAEMTSLFATGYGIYKQYYNDLSDLQFGAMFSGAIAGAVKNFKTTGSGMAQAISNLGATATTAMVPLEEQLSILGMLQATMSGSEAGTKYRAVIQAAAGAGEKLGLSFVDANNQLLSMPEILSTLRHRYGETLDAMEKRQIQKAFGTQEAVAVIDLLYGSLGALSANIDGMAGAMQKGTSFTEQMAMAMNVDPGAGLTLIAQQWHNLVEVVGKVFLPVLTPVFTGVGLVIRALKWLAETPAGKTLVFVTGVMAAAVTGFWAFTAAAAALSFALPLVTASLASLGAMVAAVSWPVWLVIGAVGLLYLSWKKNFGGIQETMGRWWNTIVLVAKGVRALFSSLSNGVGVIRGQLAEDIRAAGLVGLVITAARVAFRMTEYFGGLWAALETGFSSALGVLSPVLDTLVWSFMPLWDVIKAVGGAVAWLANLIAGGAAGSQLSGWRQFGEIVGTVLASAFKWLAVTVRMALLPMQLTWQLVGMLARGFVWVGEAIGNSVGWAVTTVERLPQAISGVVDSVLAVFGRMYEGIKWGFFNLTPVRWLIQAFQGVTDYLTGIDWSTAGAKIMSTLAAGIKSTVMAPVEVVKTGLSKLRDFLPFSDAKVGPLSALTLSGRRIMDTLGVGVRAAAPGLKKAVSGALAGTAAVMTVGTTPGVAAPPPQPEVPAVVRPVAAEAKPSVSMPAPPVLPDIAARATWHNEEVAKPVMPDVQVQATALLKTIVGEVPGIPDVAAKALWQPQEAAVPDLPEAAGRAVWDAIAPGAPQIPDIMGTASWHTDEVARPVIPDIQAKAALKTILSEMPGIPDIAGKAIWGAQEVAAPAMPKAAWEVLAPMVPDLPDLNGEAAWQPREVEPPPLPGLPEKTVTAVSQREHDPGSTRSRQSSGQPTIHIANLNLPGVTHAEDFVSQLTQMVEESDV